MCLFFCVMMLKKIVVAFTHCKKWQPTDKKNIYICWYDSVMLLFLGFHFQCKKHDFACQQIYVFSKIAIDHLSHFSLFVFSRAEQSRVRPIRRDRRPPRTASHEGVDLPNQFHCAEWTAPCVALALWLYVLPWVD